MVRFDKNANELLKVACSRIITGYESRAGHSPSSLYFNKVITLLHREIGKDGLSLNLPHCWYRWGDEVARVLMPHNVRWEYDSGYPKTKIDYEFIGSRLNYSQLKFMNGLINKED